VASLRAAASAAQPRRFLVNADEGARWQSVVEVMDVLRGQGIEAISFATKRVS